MGSTIFLKQDWEKMIFWKAPWVFQAGRWQQNDRQTGNKTEKRNSSPKSCGQPGVWLRPGVDQQGKNAWEDCLES